MGICHGMAWDKPLHLRQTPLDGAMAYSTIEAVSGGFTLHDFEPGQVIVNKGDQSDAVYGIVSGRAVMILSDGKRGQRVNIGVNNFIGGFGLFGDTKSPPLEPVKVVGKSVGKYIKLTKQGFGRIEAANPKAARLIADLIRIRVKVLEIPYFKNVITEWPESVRLSLASLFRYESFARDQELVAESGKSADRLLILVKGQMSLANMRKTTAIGDAVYNISEEGKLLNLTSLFYNYDRNYWDILASPTTESITQIMTLSRGDFRKFCSSGIVDCKKTFERASIEYLLREMRKQHRLFFHIVDEKHMSEFCSLWSLKEYAENVKIPGHRSFESCRKSKAKRKNTRHHLFHVVVGGSADAYSIERQVKSDWHLRKAHRRELLYGSAMGVLSPKLADLNRELTLFSGSSRCLMVTMEQEDFDRFFKKIGKHEQAMALAEENIVLKNKFAQQNADPEPMNPNEAGNSIRLEESPMASVNKEVKFPYNSTAVSQAQATNLSSPVSDPDGNGRNRPGSENGSRMQSTQKSAVLSTGIQTANPEATLSIGAPLLGGAVGARGASEGRGGGAYTGVRGNEGQVDAMHAVQTKLGVGVEAAGEGSQAEAQAEAKLAQGSEEGTKTNTNSGVHGNANNGVQAKAEIGTEMKTGTEAKNGEAAAKATTS